jgi:hypothetical protein
MKKILLVVAIAIGFWSCQKEETPEDVTFKLTYSLDKGASMTRAGEDLYASFYENFVKTKKVGYPKYELTFYKGTEVAATFTGEWDATLVTLPEGEYRVVGTSKSKATGVDQHETNYQYSKMSLDFEEKVVISKGQTSLTLNPTYDCYLVFFDAKLIGRANVWGPDNNNTKDYCRFFDAGGIKYAFINSASRATEISYTAVGGADEGTLTISAMEFKIGKYYCLDTVVTGYQLPPMENGF